MMAYIDNEQIPVPDKLTHRTVIQVMPLDYLKSDHAHRHHRLQVFATKGVQCVVPGCDCKGAFLAVTAESSQDLTRGLHYDVYTKDFQLMTVDHHIAKANGGGDVLENKFPMCERHNSKKGSKDPDTFYQNIALNGSQQTAKKWRPKINLAV